MSLLSSTKPLLSSMRRTSPTTLSSFSSSLLNSSFSFSTLASITPLNATSLTLYQYKICPFCLKTKSILTYTSLPYTTVEVNPLTKSQLKPLLAAAKQRGEEAYKKVPIGVFHGVNGEDRRVNGSEAIIPSIDLTVASAKYIAASAKDKDGKRTFDDEESKEWLTWCDNSLSPKIYPVITQSFKSSLSTFSYVDNVTSFSTVDKILCKYLGAAAMSLARGKILKKYGIINANDSLKTEMETWANSGLNGKLFQGGVSPNISDCGVYGVLKGLELSSKEGGGWFEDIAMGNGEVKEWFGRMDKEVGTIR